MTDNDPWLNSKQAAELWGVKVMTWRAYVMRGYAPAPDDPGDETMPPTSRRPRWRTSTVLAAKRARKRAL